MPTRTPRTSRTTAAATPPSVIVKRDGTILPFEKERIVEAIAKAMASVGMKDRGRAVAFADRVVAVLAPAFSKDKPPSVEQVQDTVERVLVEAREVRLARAYISYRARRGELRREKQQILEKEHIDEVDKELDVNALRVLKSRYLARDGAGRLAEGPKQLFTRVAVHTYLPSLVYDARFYAKDGGQAVYKEEGCDPAALLGNLHMGSFVLNRFHIEALKTIYDRANRAGQMRLPWSALVRALKGHEVDDHGARAGAFYEMMRQRRFLPNTPALANFGRALGMGSACFVLDIGDSMEKIMETLQNAAFIFKAGGGVGYNFSKLRPEGDRVQSTSGAASGPISFMGLFDKMTDVIKQGGIRRGANMGILNSNHPDIEQFVTAKKGNKALTNFNISILLMPDFWKAYKKNEEYALVNPRTGAALRRIHARTLFDLIVYQAWESAEPGVIFYDRVNEHNPFLESLGPIVTTNPCGEVLLYPNESCNLGSVNVYQFVRREGGRKAIFDWEGLKETVYAATEFLDNVIDVNKFPLPQIEAMSMDTRKIGLGVMGLADALFALRIPYDSKEGLRFMERLAESINYWSKEASIELAKSRGSFPLFSKSFYPKGKMPVSGFYKKAGQHFDWPGLAARVKKEGLRNSFTTVIAPTGSISMIAGTSSGMEPVFSLVFEKNVAVGSFYYIDEEFERAMKEFGIYDEGMMKEIAAHGGSLQHVPYLPPVVKRVFRVAHDLAPESHIRALAAFQKWVDSSISKTINFPAHATIDDMKKAYLLAYELGCKDVTVYRDSSIQNQVLSAPASTAKPAENGQARGVLVQPGTTPGAPGKCPKCETPLVRGEGCVKCPSCGWGMCA